MLQFAKCTMGMCKGSQDFLQQSIQERISQMHAKGHNQQNTMARDHLPGNQSQAKKIFSFRLNCYRQYDDSDKKKNLLCQGPTQRRDTIIRLHEYKSSEKTRTKICEYQPSNHQSNRLFHHFSPLRLKPVPQPNVNNVIKKPSVALSAHLNPPKQHRIVIPAHQHIRHGIDLFQKKSSQTQYSSKNSENPFLKPITTIASQSSAYTFQEVSQGQNKAEQKCQPQYLFASFISKNSNHEQKINDQFPTFVHLDSAEPPRFFEDVKTIKTIISKQEVSQQSLRTSIIDFNERFSDSHMAKTQKNCMMRKDKKKTAYFNVLEQQSETQRTLIDNLREEQIRQQNMEQESDYLHSSSQNGNYRTVKFCLPQSKNALIVHNPPSSYTKENRPISKCNNNMIYPPPFHNLVQSNKRHQISIGNSIKQLNQPQESPFKYKYVNTIKSIGEQSIFSQNSYIDIKYMQSINSKRAIHKLI